MAALLSTHLPFIVVGTVSGNQESIFNYQEAAGQTFKPGSVVELNGSGNVIAWDDATFTRIILGVSLLAGQNLGSAGAGAAPIFGPIGFPGGPTYGVVPNQPNAVNILHGAPFVNGMSLVAKAVSDTIFEGQVDASSGATYNMTIANIGSQFGLTVDGNGWWYVDIGKVTVGTNTCVVIQSLNQQDLVVGSSTTQQNNGRVRFTFNIAQTSVQGG